MFWCLVVNGPIELVSRINKLVSVQCEFEIVYLAPLFIRKQLM